LKKHWIPGQARNDISFWILDCGLKGTMLYAAATNDSHPIFLTVGAASSREKGRLSVYIE
jgi:hypothetical protein